MHVHVRVILYGTLSQILSCLGSAHVFVRWCVCVHAIDRVGTFSLTHAITNSKMSPIVSRCLLHVFDQNFIQFHSDSLATRTH